MLLLTIVIIILAAIVIFAGLNTPDRANLAKFMQEISDFRTAIQQDFMQKKAEYAVEGKTRNDAQIYYAIAKNKDYIDDINKKPTTDGTVASIGVTMMPEGLMGSDFYEIISDTNVKDWKINKAYYTARGESGEKHYVTDAGETFILPGYLVQENGQNKWYVNERKYYVSEEPIYIANNSSSQNGLEDNELPTASGTKPYFPSDRFKQLEGTDLTTGLVITDKSENEEVGNEYVWIEVPNANLGGNPTYGPDYSEQGLIVAEITDETIEANKEKIEAALWAYAGTLIARTGTDSKTTTNGCLDEWFDSEGKNAATSTNTNDTAGCGLSLTEYNTKYKNMLKSVYNNGGFWIGRYEAGIEGSTNNLNLARTETSARIESNTTQKPVSKVDSIPYTYVYCSEAQYLANNVESGSYNSSLMFGIQWDLVLKYLQATNAVSQTEITSNSEGWGNYYTVEYGLNQTTVHGSVGTAGGYHDPNWSLITSPYVHPIGDGYESVILSTGATERNARKNIYDLAGNMEEWTLECYTPWGGPVCRGGIYCNSASDRPASERAAGDAGWTYHTVRSEVSVFHFTKFEVLKNKLRVLSMFSQSDQVVPDRFLVSHSYVDNIKNKQALNDIVVCFLLVEIFVQTRNLT